jgi:CheY-like chemotaxis protein
MQIESTRRYNTPGFSGDQLVREIRAIQPDMPIILCTGYSSQMDEAKANSLGINVFAYKPLTRKDIAKQIRKVLDAK